MRIDGEMKSAPNSVSDEKREHHALILGNRVRNRYSHFKKRFRRAHIDCFRLYDWDIPEVRAVVDYYAGHVVVGEYVRWQTGPQWLPRMAKAVAEALEIPAGRVHIKRRQTNVKEGPRYKKLSSKGERMQVRERELSFWVNLQDYLDTGLFSDHRDTRVIIKGLAKGKNFLNLFAYTGAFTCAAALGEAKTTVTVDRSGTYLDWAKDNLKLNKLWGPQHALVQADAGTFLSRAYQERRRFTLAFVDPPSFFHDKKHQAAVDINKGHPQLIRDVLRVMLPGSEVFFSCNHQRFEPDLEGLPVTEIKEITPKTIPEDYRNLKIHRCWRMRAA